MYSGWLQKNGLCTVLKSVRVAVDSINIQTVNVYEYIVLVFFFRFGIYSSECLVYPECMLYRSNMSHSSRISFEYIEYRIYD